MRWEASTKPQLELRASCHLCRPVNLAPREHFASAYRTWLEVPQERRQRNCKSRSEIIASPSSRRERENNEPKERQRESKALPWWSGREQEVEARKREKETWWSLQAIKWKKPLPVVEFATFVEWARAIGCLLGNSRPRRLGQAADSRPISAFGGCF